MKLVSIRTRYGGASAVLCARNKDEATGALYHGRPSDTEMRNRETASSHSANSFSLDFFFFLL